MTIRIYFFQCNFLFNKSQYANTNSFVPSLMPQNVFFIPSAINEKKYSFFRNESLLRHLEILRQMKIKFVCHSQHSTELDYWSCFIDFFLLQALCSEKENSFFRNNFQKLKLMQHLKKIYHLDLCIMFHHLIALVYLK